MTNFFEFALLGLALGGTYGLLSLGLVVIYRGSGVLNFAQGAFAYLGATLYYYFRVDLHFPAAASVIAAVLAGFLVGFITNAFWISRMVRSAFTRLIATLALLIFIENIIDWRLNDVTYQVHSFLPSFPVEIVGGLRVGVDRLIILGIVLLLSAVLYVVYSRSHFGVITSAVASNELGAATLGHSPTLVGSMNWGVGAALGAFAGVLLVPIIGLAPETMSLMVIPALAAAMAGGFSSFGYVLAAGLAIGLAQSEFNYYVPNIGGLAYAIPFAFIMVVPLLRGRVIPGRGVTSVKLPEVGLGRVRYWPLLVAVVLAALLTHGFPTEWQLAFNISCIAVLLALSVVVISGYAGQISLCQLALAGMAGWVTSQLSADIGLPFIAALILGPLVAVPIGFLVGLPALRTRGLSLAIGTLGFAVVATSLIFDSQSLTGGVNGTNLTSVTLAGWNIYPVTHPWRFGLVTLVAAALAGVVVANLRASSTGRRLLAVRANERAAASLGIQTDHTKLYAFMVSAAIAGIGGVLYTYLTPNISYGIFDILDNITLVLYVVLAGIGFATGGLLAGLLYSGGLIGEVFILTFHSSTLYQAIASGLLLPALVKAPDGIVKLHIGQGEWLSHYMRRARAGLRAAGAPGTSAVGVSHAVVAAPAPSLADDSVAETERLSQSDELEYDLVDRPEGLSRPEQARVPAGTDPAAPRPVVLAVEGLTVRFGGVTAVDDVSFHIRRGEVVGLIGANGAGKTTVIDAISGLVPEYEGAVSLFGTKIDSLNAPQRAMRGIRRTFQSVELFDDVSLFENLLTACEDHSTGKYFSDLVRPSAPRLSETAAMMIRQFNLTGDLDRRPTEISYGSRRIAAIARALARPCDLLLLDEPTAGLDLNESQWLGNLARTVARDRDVAVLLVEHNVDVVMAASDYIVVLDFGRVIARDRPGVISSLEVVQNAYLGREFAMGVAAEADTRSP